MLQVEKYHSARAYYTVVQERSTAQCKRGSDYANDAKITEETKESSEIIVKIMCFKCRSSIVQERNIS